MPTPIGDPPEAGGARMDRKRWIARTVFPAALVCAFLLGRGSTRGFRLGTGLLAERRPSVRFAGKDLRAADLSEYDLTGVDLAGANLAGMQLAEARLERADLRRANLA